MFIAIFALATVVIVGILVSYMSNWVNDMISTQTQVFFSKQSYWNAYSGVEIAGSKKIASLEGVLNANVTFATGTITVSKTTTPDEYLGGNKISSITSVGSDVRGRSRSMKLTIGNPSPAEYGLFFDGSTGDFVEIGSINEKMEMQVDDETNAITYVVGGGQADFSISLWLKPDYLAMPTFGVFFAVNNCEDDDPVQTGCNNERGIVMGLTNDNPGYLRIWHDERDPFFRAPTEFSSTGVSADIWNHVVYTRSAATPGAGVGTIYLNGVLLGTDNPDDNSWFKDADDGELWHLDTDIDVGPPPEKSQNYAGGLDEVAIWRTALSLAQIQTLYIQGMSFDVAANMSTELVAHWNFDGDGVDGSSPKYTATVTGAAYTGF